MEFAVNAAVWVVGKALSPLSDGLLEAWAASSELGPNIRAVKMELLYAQGMLDNARGREIRSPALKELLQELRGLAYNADDVLDELDYFRIQDELEDTYEVADRGCLYNLVRDAGHMTRAVGKQLHISPCSSAAHGGNPYRPEEDTRRWGICGAWPCKAPRKKTPKLDFDRVGLSRRMKYIVEQLQPVCAKVSTILDLELLGSAIGKLELLGSGHGIGNGTSTSRSITTSQSTEAELVGRDSEMNSIVEDITKGEYFQKDITTLPIVGPGGIGKTTLTQYIYNSSEVQKHFEIRVWICVSLDFSVYRLTQEIAKCIPKAEDEENRMDGEPNNLDQLQKLIEKRLKNKRVLLVLDDVWKYGDKQEWERLLLPFKKGQVKGNIVLVTTRFLGVAEVVSTANKVIQLDGLKPADFWSFFMACVFGETTQQSEGSDLLCIGKQVVEKLKGSPLAAKTVGRLLGNNLTPAHWRRVLESKEWESQTEDHDIMPALKLSYDYLSFPLQQCFAYCALFPEDYKFHSEELICFWIGLDILCPGHPSKRIEDLVNYGFFKKETHGQCTYYIIHDLLHDLALNVLSQECLSIDSSRARHIDIAPSICHLSINMSSEDGTSKENFRKELSKIRNRLKSESLHTLMLFGEYDATFVDIFSYLFKDTEFLRVVHLSRMSNPVESILPNFSKLLHLRYLRLGTKYGSKIHLPSSLSRLYHLRILDMGRWHGAWNLPRDLSNLVKLRYFIVPNDRFELHVNAAVWVVGKALSSLSDGLLEAWAASSELGPNIRAVKMQLLYAQGMLDNARGREILSPALKELLQELRGADDILDELDYFRIQDELEGTYEVADRGCLYNLVRDAGHVTRAVGKQLHISPCSSAAHGGNPYRPEEGTRRWGICGAWPCKAPQKTPKLYFDRVDLSRRMKYIVEQLQPVCAKVSTNLTPDHWTRVLESKEWESQTGDHDILSVLKLSYDDLPFPLQQCFAYCALFPEDYEFDSEELICFWIGLDILCPGHPSKRIEDTGLDYLNDLVNYGFFQKETHGQRTYYIIHDLLHELALKVSSQECLSIDSSRARHIDIAPSICHLSINMSSEDGTSKENLRKELGKIGNRLKSESLRTLMLFGEYDAPVESILPNFPKLVHLRYLRLGSTYGSKIHLPSSLSRLYHLRILDMRGWHGAWNLPRDLSNLVKLRHFIVPNDADELHSNISNVGKLHCLQELRRFQVKKENGFELRELGQLAELGGSLSIYNIERVQVNEAGEAKLLFKNRLQKLTLNWDKGRSNKDADKDDQVLENLRPHSNIRELCIDGHGGPTCPTWLGTNLSVKGLEALRLDGVAWKTLPPLGELCLINEFGEVCFGCITGGHFQHLKRLELVSLPNLKKWVAKEACPMLFCTIEVLIVRDCSKLVELPFSHCTCYPLEGDEKVTLFPNLREFEVCNSPNLSVPLIPWTDTLCSVMIRHVGSSLLDKLTYSKSSSIVELKITGKDDLHSLDEVLIFKSLTELQELEVSKCPPMELKHLPMLTSLKTLIVNDSNNVLGSLGDVEWQLPIEHLGIKSCTANGKELTQLLSHLPKLSDLSIWSCEKIARLGVVVKQQQTTAVKLEDTQATDEQQQITEELEEEKAVIEPVEKEEDGLLLFPAHLSNSLRELMIYFCEELSLVAGGGDLQALRSLQTLDICYCPKFLSDYKTSSCCPFPSSLQSLDLSEAEGMKTLEPLSNLTSLTRLEIRYCGEDLRGEGLWPLLTQGQLSELEVIGSPNFFAGSDLMRGLQDEEEQRLLRPSSKLRELYTPDIAGLLVAPICTFLSSSLTNLEFSSNREVERFTKEQEDALQLLTLLQDLRFWYCDKLERLPAGLHGLANLKRLRIYRCPAIRSLPKGGLPNSLQELDVICCGNEELKQRCGKLMGTIPKISL